MTIILAYTVLNQSMYMSKVQGVLLRSTEVKRQNSLLFYKNPKCHLCKILIKTLVATMISIMLIINKQK